MAVEASSSLSLSLNASRLLTTASMSGFGLRYMMAHSMVVGSRFPEVPG